MKKATLRGLASTLAVATALGALSSTAGATQVAGRDDAQRTGAERSVTARAASKSLTLVRASENVIEVGSAVTFTGTAPDVLAGLQVTLRRKDSKKAPWLKVGNATIAEDGTYEVSGTAGPDGKNRWQTLVLDKKSSPQKHTSPLVKTPVYGWYFLSDEKAVADQSNDGSYPYIGRLTAGGTKYPNSVSFGSYTSAWDWDEPSWIEYNVSYRCVTLKASLGIDDSSETGTNATFYVSVDGARSSVGTKGLGPATEVSVDVTNALRVRLEGIPNSSGLYGYGGFGDAQVLCTSAP